MNVLDRVTEGDWPRRHRGLLPLPFDSRDRKYRFTRRYGATALANIPDEFSVDAGLTDPDQEADNRPTECTAYGKTDLATDMDLVVYEPDYTYAMTLRRAGLPPETQGADLRMSFESVLQYGLLPKEAAPDNSGKSQEEVADFRTWISFVDRAVVHAQASYRWIYDDIYDHFDDIRSAIITFFRAQNKRQGVDWGIPWFSVFSQKDELRFEDVRDLPLGTASWHDVNIKGWKLIGGEPFLVVKWWGGTSRKYFSRDLVNYLYSIPGTGAGMYDPTGNRSWSIFGIIIEMFPKVLTLKNILLFWKAAHPDMEEVPPAPAPAPAPKYEWNSPESVKASIRKICAEEGLSLGEQTDTMVATIGAESEYNPNAVHQNRNEEGSIISTDWGLCQWNDLYHGNEISPADALHDPEKAVRLMCAYWKRGQRKLWVGYSSGRYKAYL